MFGASLGLSGPCPSNVQGMFGACFGLQEVRTEGVPSILRDGTSDDRRLAKLGVPFDHPKPLSVAQRIVRWFTQDPGDLVLDFFAGSGTTGHDRAHRWIDTYLMKIGVWWTPCEKYITHKMCLCWYANFWPKILV